MGLAVSNELKYAVDHAAVEMQMPIEGRAEPMDETHRAESRPLGCLWT